MREHIDYQTARNFARAKINPERMRQIDQHAAGCKECDRIIQQAVRDVVRSAA